MGILFIFSLFGWSLALQYFLPGIKAGAALFAAYLGMAAFSIVFGLYLGAMIWTAYALTYGGIAAFIVFLVLFTTSRDKKCWKGWLQPAPVFTLIAGIGLFLVTWNSFPSIHDEFSHWAKAVKVMALFDTGYLRPFSTLSHADYPPALSVLQYAVVRVFGWREGMLYFVNGLSILASFAYLLEDAKWKRLGWAGLFLVVAMAFYAIPNPTFSFASLLIDGPMAIVFTAALLKAVTARIEKNHEMLPVLLSGLLLALMKTPSGLLFAVAVVGCMAFQIKLPLQPSAGWRRLARGVVVALCVLFVVVSYESWNVYYNLHSYQTTIPPGSPPAFSLELLRPTSQVNNGANELFGPVTPLKAEILRTAVRSLILDSFPSARIGGITILGMTLLSGALFAAAWRLSPRQERGRVVRAASVLLAVALCYMVGTYMAYVSYTKTVTEIFRYTGIILIPMLVTPLYFLLRTPQDKQDARIRFAIAAALVAFLGFGFTWKTWPLAILPNPHKEPLTAYKNNRYLDAIRDRVFVGDHVLVLSPIDDITTLDIYSMQYYLLPTYSYLTTAREITPRKLAQIVKDREITLVIAPVEEEGGALSRLPNLPWEVLEGLATYRVFQ